MLLDAHDCQLLLVDFQQKLLPAIHEHESVLANARRLAAIAKIFEVPVWATEQNPDRLGPNDAPLRALCDRTVSKMLFSGLTDELAALLRPPAPPAPAPPRRSEGNARSLPKHLKKAASPNDAAAAAAAPDAGRNSIVIAGCEAHVCLLQTALVLLEQEFEVWVATDACGSRTERNRDAAYDRLAGAGCELVTTEMVAFEWLRTAAHPAFREVLALIK